MAEGTIKKLTDKGFGFIDLGGGDDLFFHMSNLEGVRFDQCPAQVLMYFGGTKPALRESLKRVEKFFY